MKKTILILAGWLAGLVVHAGNILTLSSASGSPGDEVTVSVSLENTDEPSAVQLSIPLDDALTFVEGSAAVGPHASTHSVIAGVKDRVLTLMIFSLSLSSVESGSGEIASFRLKLGNQPKTFSLGLTDVMLTNSDGTLAETGTAGGTVTIVCPKASYSSMTLDYGRVPIQGNYSKTLTVQNVGNETLTVTNLVFTDATFSTSQELPVSIEPGARKIIAIDYSPTARGNVSSELFVVCNSISKLNTITLKAQPYAVNELHVTGASGVSDEEVTISLTMNNMDPITGFQFEFRLPDVLKYVDGSFALSGRKTDHSLLTTCSNSVLRAISYSSSNSPFSGNDGEIATFKVRLDGRNGATLKADKAILTAMVDGTITDVASDNYGAYVSISSPRISVASGINMGEVPVTEECKSVLSIRNQGAVPLTVSRITFDNDAFSVDRQCPIVIPAYSSANVTVEYTCLEEADFSALMQIYSNDPDNRLRNIVVTGSRFAPNYLRFDASDVLICNDQTVEVTLDNYDPISGIQFDVNVPLKGTGSRSKPVYMPADIAYSVQGRAEGMTVQWRQTDKGTFRYFCYSLGGDAMERGNDKVLTLRFTPTDAIEAGVTTFSITDITLSTPELIDKYAGDNLTVSFNVVDALPGDVNGDGRGLDIVLMVDFILNRHIDFFIFEAGDLNRNGVINGMDLVKEVSLVMSSAITSVKARKSPEQHNEKSVSEVILSENQNGGLSIGVKGNEEYILAQFVLELNDGQKLTSIDACDKNHVVAYQQIDNQRYAVLCYSLRNNEFANNINMVDIHLEGTGKLSVADMMLVDANRVPIWVGGTEFSETTGIRLVNGCLDKTSDIYSISGTLVKKNANSVKGLEKGIYIINGKPLIVK